MNCADVVAGAPCKRASEIVRTVIEFARGQQVAEMPSSRSLRRFTKGGAIMASAKAAKLIAAAPTVALHIDETRKFDQAIHGATAVTPDGHTLSLGVVACPTKSATDQLSGLGQLQADIHRAAKVVHGIEMSAANGNTVLQKTRDLVTDGGKTEAKMCREMIKQKEKQNRESGMSAATAKANSGIDHWLCHKHFLNNIMEKVQKDGLPKTGVPADQRSFDLMRVLLKGYRKKAKWGHSVGRRFDAFCRAKNRPNLIGCLPRYSNTRMYHVGRSMPAAFNAMPTVLSFANTSTAKAVRESSGSSEMAANHTHRTIVRAAKNTCALAQLAFTAILYQLLCHPIEQAASGLV